MAAVSLATGSILVVLAVRAPRPVILITLAILPFLGLLRRATGSYLGATDPMLFIAPAVAVVCVVAGSIRGQRFVATALGKVVLGFTALGTVGAFNPVQGSLKVGVIGAGLFVGPMVWFFVGQRFCDAQLMRRVQSTMAVIAVVVVVYGTKQLLFGFVGFEQQWLDRRLGSYSALSVQGHIRPFSTFASSAEYSYFMVLGAVLFALKLRTQRWFLFGVPVALFATACFYAGSRGIFVSCCGAALLVTIALRTRRLGRSIVLCLLLSVLGLALLRFVPLSSGDSISAATRNRTLQGLAQPFDRDVSTLGIHIGTFTHGLGLGLRNPLGTGAGATNLAGSRFGDLSVSSEHDLPNVLIAYGWLGGVLLIFLVTHVYRMARRAAEAGDPALLGPAIFVLVLFGSWFVGGLYAISAILWFFVGAIDGRIEKEFTDDRDEPATVLSADQLQVAARP